MAFAGDPMLKVSHPNFRHLFSSPIYSDTGDEFAPFGSDEGFDVMHDLANAGLSGRPTLRQVLSIVGIDDWSTESYEEGDTETVIAAGYSLLRLTGQIDKEGRLVLRDAVELMLDQYGSPYQRVASILLADLDSLKSP